MRHFILFALFFLYTSSALISEDQLSVLISRQLALPIKFSSEINEISSHGLSVFDRVGAKLLIFIPGLDSKTTTTLNGVEILSVDVRGVPSLSPVISEVKAHAASIADVMTQYLDGNALVITQASTKSSLEVISASEKTMKGYRAKQSSALYWNKSSRTFNTLYGFSLGEVDLIDELSKIETLRSIIGENSEITVDGEEVFVQLTLSDSETIEVTFDLDNDVDLLFFAELYTMISTVKASVHKASVQDNIPDLYAFALEALSLVAEKNGISSNKYRLALLITEKAIGVTHTTLQEAYDNTLSTDIVTSLPGATHKRKMVEVEEVQWVQERRVYSKSMSVPDFQIVLWGSIFLLAAIISALAVLCAIDTGSDTLLYRTPLDIQMSVQHDY
eukprot:TRINITY_DN316_c0_g1_i1.p1 TRINITY_DN316_c0_g1~~TRINITY_DN316_c0_g1_i1.p1  ORF type:complete len:389 (+),score=74.88 TRINITY_DN316_c0_g1_i1:70-1236(+)